jgi:hypothetical protein
MSIKSKLNVKLYLFRSINMIEKVKSMLNTGRRKEKIRFKDISESKKVIFSEAKLGYCLLTLVML